MKKLFIIFAAFVSISATAQDMQKYLKETEEMVTQKKYQEANERFIWFQDHSLENDAAMTGVRLSFALASWKSLADIYPQAMTAMKEMRDKKTSLLIDSNGSTNLFADVTSLNRTLNEKGKTIELFEKISEKDPDKAKRCWYYAKDDLFKAKRYDIIRNFIGNPINEFQAIKDQREMLIKPFNNEESDHSLKIYADNDFVEKCIDLMKFSVAVDDTKDAKKIRKKAMGIVKDNRLRDIKIQKEQG